MIVPVLLIGGLLLMAGGAGKKRRRPAPGPAPGPTVREPTVEEAEAIIYCEMEGGIATALQTPEGETYFVCTWPDGRMAETVAYHRGEVVPKCPPEMVYDTANMMCVVPGDVVVDDCPPGFRWDASADGCVPIEVPPDDNEDDGGTEYRPGALPNVRDPATSGGSGPGGIFTECPPNYFYDALHGVCCPDGFFWHVEDQMCRPLGYSGNRRAFAGHKGRSDAVRYGFAGCGRRGHCGVRPR